MSAIVRRRCKSAATIRSAGRKCLSKFTIPRTGSKRWTATGSMPKCLFPNGPGGTFFYDDAEFELDCVRAYNDALAEFRQVSDRFIPLAVIAVHEPDRNDRRRSRARGEAGHMGINMLADPSVAVKGLKNLSDPFWHPLWNVCQELGVGVHLHASAGLAGKLSLPQWKGYTPRQSHCVSTLRNFCTATQIVPFLIFSGMLEQFPRLNWVFAETGLGWVSSVLEACDHEWEKRHLWTEGLITRPSELFRRQIYRRFLVRDGGHPAARLYRRR